VSIDVGFLVNLGPALLSGFQPHAIWSARLGIAGEL